MTVVRLVSIFPQLENAGQIRSHLEGRVSSTPGTSLSVNVVGEMPTFVETTVFDSLESYGKARDADTADPSILEHRTQIGKWSRQPVVVRLLSPIVSPAEPMGSNIRYNERIVIFPTSEGHDAVGSALEELTRAQQASGRVHARLARTLFSHDGAAFTLGDSFETMAELENVSRSRTAAISELRSKIGPLVRQIAIQRLTEVIVPAN